MLQRDLRTRRLVAKYIRYLEVFGYLFVAVVAVAIAVLWFVKIDDVAESASSPKPLIKPHEKEVTRKADAVVLKVLVRNHDDVRKGQPLVEVCDDPAWVGRYRAAQRADSLAAALDSVAVVVDDPTSDAKALREALRKASERWKGERSRMPKDILKAPISGVAVVGEGLAEKVIPGGKEIVKILDFDDLRISAELKGANLAHARVGQPVKVEIIETYGNGEILKSDLDRPGRWTNVFAQFNSVAEGKVKDVLQDYFAGKVVTLEEDTTFTVSKVTEIDLQATLRAKGTPEEGHRGVVDVEPFSGVKFTGRVVEGTHTASVRVRDLPDSLRAEIERTIQERFRDRIIRADGSTLSVRRIENLRIAVQMDAQNEELKKAIRTDVEPLPSEKVERIYKFVTKLDDPSPALRAKVRELALGETPTYITTKLEVVVGARRIAMMLFRKD